MICTNFFHDDFFTFRLPLAFGQAEFMPEERQRVPQRLFLLFIFTFSFTYYLSLITRLNSKAGRAYTFSMQRFETANINIYFNIVVKILNFY